MSKKIDAALAAKIDNLIERGRKAITTKKQLEKFPIGSCISYMNHNNEFKNGGYLYRIDNDWFVFITIDLKTKIRVRYKNVSKMWVGNVYKTIGDIVSLNETTLEKTKYPVMVGDIIVSYCITPYTVKRFKFSEKYKRMITWYEFFGDNQ